MIHPKQLADENGEPELRKAAAEKGTTTEFIERMLTASAKMYDLPMEGESLILISMDLIE